MGEDERTIGFTSIGREATRLVVELLCEFADMDLRPSRDTEGDEDSCDRGVDTRLEEERPNGYSEDDVGLEGMDAHTTQQEDDAHQC